MLPFESLTALDPASPYKVFAYATPNLGDYVQMLAVMQHVRVSGFVMRDNPEPDPGAVLVANGWLSAAPLPRPSDFEGIVYAGIHLSPTFRNARAKEFFEGCGVVGCRDTSTLAYLRSIGVPSYLCRCPTLTFPEYRGERSGLVFVDVEEKLAERVERAYRDRLGPARRITHDVPWLSRTCLTDGSLRDRLREAYDALQVYRTARLVVTSKVHCALPTIAFGTPLIYAGPRDERQGVFEGLTLGFGWERFKRLRLLFGPRPGIPEPVPSERVKKEYLAFLHERLGDPGRSRPGEASAPFLGAERVH